MMKNLCAYISLITFLLGCSSIFGGEADFSSREITFSNGEFSLSGTIYRPGGEGSFPGVVIVHGSRNHDGNYYKAYIEYFVSNGIAVLSYDKRGTGGSEGHLWSADFYDLARDAASGLKHLENQAFVDSMNVGFWADSQGGWIILLADSISGGADFLINKSGPAVSPKKQTLFDIERNFLAGKKVPQNILNKTLALYPKIWTYLLDDRSGWREITSGFEELKQYGELSDFIDPFYLNILAPPDHMPPAEQIEIDPSARSIDFDPVPYYRELTTPVLVFYGGKDRLVNSRESYFLLEELGNPNIQLQFYENGDHGLRVQRNPGFLFKPEFPDGYLDFHEEFIKNRQ